MTKKKKMLIAFLLGIVGCLCFGAGDWLMAYGDAAHSGKVWWLTEGVANISSTRNSVAMFIAFPGIICYGLGLFAAAGFIRQQRERRIYRVLTIFGLTPWLCLHIFYVELLNTFAVMNQTGNGSIANMVCDAVFSNLSWVAIVSEAIMLPPFIYWIWLQIRGMTFLPRYSAATPANVLVTYAVLYVVAAMLPMIPFKVGFTNGLMSESMRFYFLALIFCTCRNTGGVLDGEEHLELIP